MATILEGLNQIAEKLGGAESTSNLEALNAISGALGGSADATENAEAIANIAENASGGGGVALDGRVNFSIARTNDPSGSINIPCVYAEKPAFGGEWSAPMIGTMAVDIGPHTMMREMCVPVFVSEQGSYVEGALSYRITSSLGNLKVKNITSAEGTVWYDTTKQMVRFRSNNGQTSMNITFAVDGAVS